MHASQARKLNWCCIGSGIENIVNEFEIHEITIKLKAHLRDKTNSNKTNERRSRKKALGMKRAADFTMR